MKILVTGATGFIGSYILRTLAKDPDIALVGLCRSTSKFDLVKKIKNNVEWIEADILDIPKLKKAFIGVDRVIHAAALVSMDPRHHKLMEKVNVEGVANVVNLCLSEGIKRLVYISSVTALGAPQSQPLDESASWHTHPFNSGYAMTKYLGELEVARGWAEGLNTITIIPPFVLGASNWHHGPSSIFEKIFKGLSFYPRGSSGVVDVRDVSDMIEILIKGDYFSGERFICSAQNMTHKSLFSMIADQLDKPKPHRRLNWLLALLARQIDACSSLFLKTERIVTKEGIAIANKPFLYNNSKSVQTLGFSYRSVGKTIEEVCDAFLKSRDGGQDFGILNI